MLNKQRCIAIRRLCVAGVLITVFLLQGGALWRRWAECQKRKCDFMMNARINQRKLWYATYQGKQPILDDEGFDTGDTEVKFSVPVMFMANISASRGSAEVDMFGVNLDYTKSISTCDLDLPISETSLIWETKPEVLEDGTANKDSADYTVVQVARGMYNVVYAVKTRQKNMEG